MHTLFGWAHKNPNVRCNLNKSPDHLSHAMQVLRAVPKGARLLLECAGAVVAAAPSKFKVAQAACPVCSARGKCAAPAFGVLQIRIATVQVT